MRRGSQDGLSAENAAQFGRFLLVGCSNFVLSFAVFYLFYRYWRLTGALLAFLGPVGDPLSRLLARFGIGSADAALANVIGYSAGVVNSFVWNKYWTFGVRDRGASQFRRFVLLNLACLLLSSVSLFFFTDLLAWSYLPVWTVTMSAVTVINFVITRNWVFHRG